MLGHENMATDALSRKCELALQAITIAVPCWLQEVQKEQSQDPSIQAKIQLWCDGKLDFGYAIRGII